MKVVDVTGDGRRVVMQCKRGHTHSALCAVDDEMPGAGEYAAHELRRGIPCPTCADQALAKK